VAACKSRINKTLGYSLFYSLSGYHPITEVASSRRVKPRGRRLSWTSIGHPWKSRSTLEESKKRQKQRINPHSRQIPFKVGQQVLFSTKTSPLRKFGRSSYVTLTCSNYCENQWQYLSLAFIKYLAPPLNVQRHQLETLLQKHLRSCVLRSFDTISIWITYEQPAQGFWHQQRSSKCYWYVEVSLISAPFLTINSWPRPPMTCLRWWVTMALVKAYIRHTNGLFCYLRPNPGQKVEN
jgi:hypothetical protein